MNFGKCLFSFSFFLEQKLKDSKEHTGKNLLYIHKEVEEI